MFSVVTAVVQASFWVLQVSVPGAVSNVVQASVSGAVHATLRHYLMPMRSVALALLWALNDVALDVVDEQRR